MCIYIDIYHELGFYNSHVDGVGSGRERQYVQWHQKFLADWTYQNERRMLHAMRCGILWLLCRDGGVRWKKEMPQSARRQSRNVIRTFWTQVRLRTHGDVAVHPHRDLRRTWLWCGIRSTAARVKQTRQAACEYGLSRHTVRTVLNKDLNFRPPKPHNVQQLTRYLGRGGPHKWPKRNPDLTPCEFFLWG